MKIVAIARGSYDLRATVPIPNFLRDQGYVTSFGLHFEEGVFLARCRDGKLRARIGAAFADGSRVQTEMVRRCTPKPQRRSIASA